MKNRLILLLMLAFIVSFTSCENNKIENSNLNEENNENIINEEVENIDGVIEEIIEEEEILEEQPIEEVELGQLSQTFSSTQFMSGEEALKITDGKLIYMPEYNFMIGGSTEYKAYLTPSGKLIYMTDFIFSRLDGKIDFEVSWGFKDLNELNIRTDMGNTDDGTVLVSAVLSDKTAVKYDLFLDQWDGEPVSGLEDILCYAKVSSGTLFFDMGLTIDKSDFEGYDVIYTFTGNPYYEPQTLTSKVGQTVYIENISRIYPFDSDVEWTINAEIKDPDGNIVYTEDLTVCESYNPLDNTFFVSKGEKIVQ